MHANNLTGGMQDTPANRKKVLTKALITMADILQLNQKELSEIIGPSAATFSRIFNQSNSFINPKSKEGQLALLLLRFYRGLDALLGGNTSQCRVWLRSYNKHLNGVPVDLIKSIEGLVFVIQYLDAMRGKN
jgi:hypothetical protein